MKLDEMLKTAKVSVTQITPKNIDGLKNDVFSIKNESPVVDELIKLLGVPVGEPIRIRAGYMSYDEKHKLLFFSKNKYDLPNFLGKRPEK